MKLASQVLLLHENKSGDAIKKAFTAKIASFELDHILSITDVDIIDDGSVAIEFSDDEGDSIDCVFVHDDGATYVYYTDDFEDDVDIDCDVEVSDLGVEVPTVEGKNGIVSVDLVDLSWLELETFITILSELDDDDDDDIDEAFAYVVRNGKKVKKKLVRKKRKRIMTSKMRAGVRKAVRSRRKKKVQTSRNRKKSLRIRKRMKIKTNTSKNLKVSGTSSYRK